MAYTWLGMEKLDWDKVQELHRKGELAGTYKLYDDGSEGQIESGYSWDEIVAFHNCGGEFGDELSTVELNLPDGKKITAPEVIDISSLGCLDELEYSMWNTIQEYMALFGIRTEDDQPDWATVKAVQDKLLTVLMDAGVNFKVLTDAQAENIKKQLEEREEKQNEQ